VLNGNWSAKAEYLYVNGGDHDVVSTLPAPTRFDNRLHLYRYGINYKFGGVATARSLSAHEWTGLYAGLNAGVGLSQTNASTPESDLFGSVDIAGAGFTGGVQVGYNWQFNPTWVVGLEGDIGRLGINRLFQNWDDFERFGIKTNWYGTMRARLGYSTGPALLYFTGGAAFVNVRNDFNRVDANVQSSKSETPPGWTLGGGIESVLVKNWTAKTEYLYIDAGGQNVFGLSVLIDTGNVHFNNRFHIFRFGLNYYFNGQYY
jgi:outer membrane immunogenic protein